MRAPARLSGAVHIAAWCSGCGLPLFHLGGFGQCLQALLTAGTVYLHTEFNPAAVIDAIERDKIEFFTAGPSLIDMLVAEIGQRAGADGEKAPDPSSLCEIA